MAALSTVKSAVTEAAETGMVHGLEFSGLSGRSGAAIVGVLIAVVVAIGLRWVVVDRVNTPLVRSFDGQRPPDMEVSSMHRFGRSDRSTRIQRTVDHWPRHIADIDLYWRMTAQLAVNYRSFVRIVAENGKTVGRSREAARRRFSDETLAHWGVRSRQVRFNRASNSSTGYLSDRGWHDRSSHGAQAADRWQGIWQRHPRSAPLNVEQ